MQPEVNLPVPPRAPAPPNSGWELPARLVRIVDGDSVHVLVNAVDVWLPRALRLARINAPERGKPGSREATTYLAEMLVGTDTGWPLSVKPVGLDAWRRWIADLVLPDGRVVSDLLLEAGHATPYRVPMIALQEAGL